MKKSSLSAGGQSRKWRRHGRGATRLVGKCNVAFVAFVAFVALSGAWAAPSTAQPVDAPDAKARVMQQRPRLPLPMPVVAGAPLDCPEGSTEVLIEDTAPIRRCPTLPLERICHAADNSSNGPRVAFDADTSCRMPKRTEQWVAGRRSGQSVLWRTVCPGGAQVGDARCAAHVAEIGAYKDGHQEGPWQIYDAAGALIADRNYQRGRPQGLWRRLEGGKISEVVCYSAGKETFRAAIGAPEALGACAEELAAGADNGVVEVSEAQTKASRLATLAQQTRNIDLRVRYLKKACELVPDNAGYRKLLQTAEAEADAAKQAPPAPAPAPAAPQASTPNKPAAGADAGGS